MGDSRLPNGCAHTVYVPRASEAKLICALNNKNTEVPAHHPLTLRHYFLAQPTTETNTALENIPDNGICGPDVYSREMLPVMVNVVGVVILMVVMIVMMVCSHAMGC